MQSAAEHSKSNDSKARKLRLVRGPTCILDGRLSMREIPSQSREALEVRFIPLASTCPVAWRCLMRHVSLHPSRQFDDMHQSGGPVIISPPTSTNSRTL